MDETNPSPENMDERETIAHSLANLPLIDGSGTTPPDDLDDEDENNEDAAASEWINGVNGLPAYAFRPKNPESKHDSGPVAAMANYVYSTFRTRRLFKYFYWLIQLVLIASMVYFLTQM
jgi:hypothetical protein